jgi:hypothetical protein
LVRSRAIRFPGRAGQVSSGNRQPVTRTTVTWWRFKPNLPPGQFPVPAGEDHFVPHHFDPTDEGGIPLPRRSLQSKLTDTFRHVVQRSGQLAQLVLSLNMQRLVGLPPSNAFGLSN